MRRGFLLLVAALFVAAFGVLLSGPDVFGRTALKIGLSSLAAPLLDDPGLRGVALYRSGDYAAAELAFEEANQPYNQALAAAWTGDYATALALWDRVLIANPDDGEAAANYALVKSLFSGIGFEDVLPMEDKGDGPTMEAEIGQGSGRASSTGSDVSNADTGFQMPEVESSGLRRVPKIFDAHYLLASERWLATLADEPGLYLKARIEAEQKARKQSGTALPPLEDTR